MFEMYRTAFGHSKPRLRQFGSSSSEESLEANMKPKFEPKSRKGRRGLWVFRRLSSDDNKSARSNGSEELQLVSLWDRKASANLLCIPPRENVDDEEGSLSSGSSLSTLAEMQAQRDDLVLLDSANVEKGSSIRVIPPHLPKKDSGFDLQQYMAKREMTVTQEKWNALTMIPSPLYCIYFLLAGCWLTQSFKEEAQQMAPHVPFPEGCFPASEWHSMPAMPPLPMLAAAIGIIVHAPFSFMYHWKYAHSLPAGAARTTHWSRRMDQSMIHFASAFMAYATSGSWDFFLANCLYNADCIYRQFKTKVRPRRNKVRIIISIVAYTIPILRRGDLETFFKLWVVFGVSGWLFIQYPIGGWSHAAFHLVIALAPPLLMVAAQDLSASQEAMKRAALCAVMHDR